MGRVCHLLTRTGQLEWLDKCVTADALMQCLSRHAVMYIYNISDFRHFSYAELHYRLEEKLGGCLFIGR